MVGPDKPGIRQKDDENDDGLSAGLRAKADDRPDLSLSLDTPLIGSGPKPPSSSVPTTPAKADGGVNFAAIGDFAIGFVPVAGTIAHWDRMSPTQRTASIALDILSVIPVTRLAKVIPGVKNASKAQQGVNRVTAAQTEVLKEFPEIAAQQKRVITAQRQYGKAAANLETFTSRREVFHIKDPAAGARMVEDLATAERKLKTAATKLADDVKDEFGRRVLPGVSSSEKYADDLLETTRKAVLGSFVDSPAATAAQKRFTRSLGQLRKADLRRPINPVANRFISDTVSLFNHATAVERAAKADIRRLTRALENNIKTERVISADRVKFLRDEIIELENKISALELSNLRNWQQLNAVLADAKKLESIADPSFKRTVDRMSSLTQRKMRNGLNQLGLVAARPKMTFGGGRGAPDAPTRVKTPPATSTRTVTATSRARLRGPTDVDAIGRPITEQQQETSAKPATSVPKPKTAVRRRTGALPEPATATATAPAQRTATRRATSPQTATATEAATRSVTRRPTRTAVATDKAAGRPTEPNRPAGALPPPIADKPRDDEKSFPKDPRVGARERGRADRFTI